MRRRLAIISCALSLAAAGVVRADDAGYFGFGIEVDGEGFFLNPTLRSVTVNAVAPASPAARAGVAVGDQVIDVESHVIAGAKARDLEPLLRKRVGESLRLRLKRPSGETYDATIVAGVRPPKT